ncbi:GlcG/HbpS family heme-binding protein [Phyllobacterium salinisoli]|uniref:GlcG/HbpS family heme-binding protein n=1 Tax=Phyllobacterium salinisoli TaxID=1899321 RepID=UPI00315C52A5
MSVFAMLAAAIFAAKAMGQPQCIVIVDASGVALAAFRMAGARYLSLRSATAKARTAASTDAPSDSVPEAVRPAVAAATGGEITGLRGGLPIRLGGVLLGGIGVGSGSGEQDEQVARAALKAIDAEET